jgi:L-iditol 2-dehydrogenase
VQCSDYDYLGSRSNGALAEYVVVPRRNLVRLPAGVTLELAAMTEPAAVALHALRRGGGTGPGETVAVFGAGPIGVMAAQWARSMGAARVMLFDVVPEKVEMARRLGFEFTFLSRERDPVQVVTEHTSGTGAGLCVEAAGVPVTLNQSLAAAGRGGRVVLMGNPAKEVSLPAGLLSQFMRREVTLYGTWNSEYSACGNRDDWTTAIEAMGHGRLDLAPLVTHRVPLDQAAAALRMLRDGREFAAKVLVLP